ncbi:MAG: carboxypeptidase-like regulatory domain-containing protein [Kofleriaceae bacterium]
MTRRSRIAAVVVVAVLVVWWRADRPAHIVAPVPSARSAADRAIGHDFRAALAQIRAARGATIAPFAHGDGVTISGHVIDVSDAARPVGDVEVVFRGPTGEATTMSDAQGGYTLRVAAGTYRAFVRGDAVVSSAREGRVRLPGPPSATSAGVPDEALMTLVSAARDTADVDLAVTGGGVVRGRVIDGHGNPVAGAVLQARGDRGVRPALGTDIAESDRDGRFELRLAAGAYLVQAAHPRFAGVLRGAGHPADLVVVDRGGRYDMSFTLVDGCVISGRVIGADGRPASDGAIERGVGDSFRPAGRIEADGSFQLATTEEVAIALRAWPWKSPPAAAQTFACRAGARFEHVVFQLPDQRPDLEGVLVDATGEPVAGAFLDLFALDPGGLNQQERSDAQGRWGAYSMPAGRYRVTAHADGKGVAHATITSPSAGTRLALGGTGRLEGTTPRLAHGSFELVLTSCSDGDGMIWLPPAHRVVTVTDGHFTVDDVPACAVLFSASWQGNTLTAQATVPSGGAGHVQLDVGVPAPGAPAAFDNPEGERLPWDQAAQGSDEVGVEVEPED